MIQIATLILLAIAAAAGILTIVVRRIVTGSWLGALPDRGPRPALSCRAFERRIDAFKADNHYLADAALAAMKNQDTETLDTAYRAMMRNMAAVIGAAQGQHCLSPGVQILADDARNQFEDFLNRWDGLDHDQREFAFARSMDQWEAVGKVLA